MSQRKFRSREEVVALCTAERRRQPGLRIAFSSGVFDLLHAGHVQYLQKAKETADLVVVGVNSDRSAGALKGPLRPIRGARERAAVVAALESVDYVFVFDEANTRISIELLRPDFYIKGGDYTRSRLSSAAFVESYGGQVLLPPKAEEESTTSIVDRILDLHGAFKGSHLELPPYESRPAVFLDRDGTIIEHIDYLHEPERLTLIPGAIEAMGRLRAAGFRLVIITNQPGIGTGYFSKDDFFKVNKELLKAAYRSGVLIDRVFFCPHSRGDECGCRKPGIGLIERAVEELNINLSASFVIGDMTSDIMAGKCAGCRTILVQTGMAGRDGYCAIAPNLIAQDLSEAAKLILDEGEVLSNGYDEPQRRAVQPSAVLPPSYW